VFVSVSDFSGIYLVLVKNEPTFLFRVIIKIKFSLKAKCTVNKTFNDKLKKAATENSTSVSN
jgi:hypothetical protein